MVPAKILVGIAAIGSAGISGTYAIKKFFFPNKGRSKGAKPEEQNGQSTTDGSQASSVTPSSTTSQGAVSPAA